MSTASVCATTRCTSSVAAPRHQTLLAFLTSGCLTCRGFWDAFADQRALDIPRDLRLVVVAKDAAEESISALRKLAANQLTVVMSSAAWEAYQVPGSPYFVLVDGPESRVCGEGTGAIVGAGVEPAPPGRDDSNEQLIDRELRRNGVAPGDPSLYRTAAEIARTTE